MAEFRLVDVYNITGIGTVPVGKVERGILKVGMKTNIEGKTLEIKTIEANHEQITEAGQGMDIGISLKLVSGGNSGFLKNVFGGDGTVKLLNKHKGSVLNFS